MAENGQADEWIPEQSGTGRGWYGIAAARSTLARRRLHEIATIAAIRVSERRGDT
jgi:hypothetical protein